MAIQRRFEVQHGAVFPAGAWLVGGVEPVADFQAPALPGGARPQQVDKDTQLPLWQVQVVDADEEAGKRDKTVSVKLVSKYQPTTPENKTGLPFTPVEFVGLTALPYVDDSGQRVEGGRIQGRARIAWSFRAEGLTAPGSTGASKGQAAA